MCRPLLAVLVNCSTHKLILPTLWSESSIQIRAANLSTDILVTQWFLGSVLALLLYWLCLFSRKSPVAFWQSSLRWLEKLESTLHFWHITILSKNVVHCTNYISPEVVWPRGVLLTRLMLSHCALNSIFSALYITVFWLDEHLRLWLSEQQQDLPEEAAGRGEK